MEFYYEPHPVTPARKAELRAQGFRILDAVFAPKGWQPRALQTEAKAPPASTSGAFIVGKQGAEVFLSPDAKFDHNGDGRPGGSKPAAERGLDDLKAEAIALGITIDRRWGERRLRAEIEKAQG